MRRARMVLGGLGVLALCAGAAVPAGMPAAAQEAGGLTLTVTPTTGLTNGQLVDLVVGNIPTAEGTEVDLWFCDDPVAAGVEQSVLEHTCAPRALEEFPGGTEWVTNINVVEVYHGGNLVEEPELSCVDEPFDCAVVATVDPRGTGPVTDVVSVPVDIVPSPLLVTPVDPVDPLGAVTVYVAGDPGATLQLAQCVAFTDVPRDLPNCIAGPQVTLSEHGRGHAAMTASKTQAVAGATYDCARRPCQVVAFDAGGTELAAATIPGSYPAGRFELSRSVGLDPFEPVHVSVQNGSGFILLGMCAASVLDDSLPILEGCTLLETIFDPSAELIVPLPDRFRPAAAGAPEVVCADVPGGCVVGLGDADGHLAWYQSISFIDQVTMTLTPDHDLVDGQEMTVSLSGLVEGRTYDLFTCTPFAEPTGGCQHEAQLTGPASGTASATVVARQRYFKPGFLQATRCPGGCQVVLMSSLEVRQIERARVPYTLSAGSLTATPSTGLSDGQTITASGTGVQPTFDGPTLWIFHTGPWVLGQCAADVATNPTVVGVFTNCTTTVGGPVDVPSSGFSQPVTVAGTISRILGGTTDCTAAPGACVMILARFEEDATLTLLSTPLTFTPPTP